MEIPNKMDDLGGKTHYFRKPLLKKCVLGPASSLKLVGICEGSKNGFS